jgi:hypothetical protein
MTVGLWEVMRKCVMVSPNAIPDWPLLADCVEKLENRGAPKISQM